ncbi:MAG: hypothetical protein BWY92_01713 [Firmicutes bacterium ADurb.BinA052]|nr:MAG: hypothetical protein BWY92_01713 [Firmicutes bacterium ADurb.BinA052]
MLAVCWAVAAAWRADVRAEASRGLVLSATALAASAAAWMESADWVAESPAFCAASRSGVARSGSWSDDAGSLAPGVWPAFSADVRGA